MKNRLYIIAAGMLAAAASCTNLDVDVESQYTEYPNSPIAVEAKMSDIYFSMRGDFGRRIFELLGCASDEFTAVSYGGDYYDNGFAVNPSYHASTPSDATVDWYNNVTGAITKANKAILEMGIKPTDPQAAPARFMRAYFTYWLMDLWGAAPILDHPLADGEVVDRSPRSKVAKWIESELLEIKDQLTVEVNANTYGKPTKWAALGLLARLYTNWPVFMCDDVTKYTAGTANEKAKACVDICNEIIGSHKFNLGVKGEWRMKFAPTNGPQIADFIYAMPYDAIKQTGFQHGRAFTWKDMKACNPTVYGEAMGNSFGGYMTLTPEFVDLYNLEGDERNASILGLLDGGKMHVYDPNTYKPTDKIVEYKGQPIVLSKEIKVSDYIQLNVGKNFEGYNQGYRPVKFFIKADQYNNGRNQSNDFPLIRYADVLLMKAEAMVRSGEAGSKSVFNEVRSFVSAPELTADPTLEDIYKERGREFLGEGLRRDDMIRFGHYEDEFFPHYKTGEFAAHAKFNKEMRIFPLHQDVLNANPHWKQNLGY